MLVGFQDGHFDVNGDALQKKCSMSSQDYRKVNEHTGDVVPDSLRKSKSFYLLPLASLPSYVNVPLLLDSSLNQNCKEDNLSHLDEVVSQELLPEEAVRSKKPLSKSEKKRQLACDRGQYAELNPIKLTVKDQVFCINGGIRVPVDSESLDNDPTSFIGSEKEVVDYYTVVHSHSEPESGVHSTIQTLLRLAAVSKSSPASKLPVDLSDIPLEVVERRVKAVEPNISHKFNKSQHLSVHEGSSEEPVLPPLQPRSASMYVQDDYEVSKSTVSTCTDEINSCSDMWSVSPVDRPIIVSDVFPNAKALEKLAQQMNTIVNGVIFSSSTQPASVTSVGEITWHHSSDLEESLQQPVYLKSQDEG